MRRVVTPIATYQGALAVLNRTALAVIPPSILPHTATAAHLACCYWRRGLHA